jgi:hypothetical protein
MHNGRCRRHGGTATGPRTQAGKLRRAACCRAVVIRLWDAAKAEGKTRLGELREEGRASIVKAAKLPKPAEQRAKMSEAHRQVEAEKRGARYRERIAEHGAMLASVFQDHGGSDVR